MTKEQYKEIMDNALAIYKETEDTVAKRLDALEEEYSDRIPKHITSIVAAQVAYAHDLHIGRQEQAFKAAEAMAGTLAEAEIKHPGLIDSTIKENS